MAGGYALWFWSRVHQDGSYGDESTTLGDGVIFLHFDNDVFFNFILPPIIFSAGACVRAGTLLWRSKGPTIPTPCCLIITTMCVRARVRACVRACVRAWRRRLHDA